MFLDFFIKVIIISQSHKFLRVCNDWDDLLKIMKLLNNIIYKIRILKLLNQCDVKDVIIYK